MPTNNSFDESRFITVLEEAISKVKTEEDPVVLNEMKKLFKQHVPFTLRTYVAAYLAKQGSQESKSNSHYQSRFEGAPRGERPPRRERTAMRRQETSTDTITSERPAPRRVTIDPEFAATIFIGIGKNRRVYTRDLITLLMQTCQLDRERIGHIRNQENYSFVELFKDDVDNVINTLNGYNYRGRALTVSYARKKDVEDSEKPVSEDTSASTTSFSSLDTQE